MAPQPDYDIGAAAEHRMNLATRYLRVIGCQASGIVSHDDHLLKAVRSETRSHDYAAVVLATGRPRRSWLARRLHLDPVHQLRWRLGKRLIVFPLGAAAPHPTLLS